MSLTRNHQHVTVAERLNGDPDCFVTIADLDGIRRTGQSSLADQGCIFASRIVIGDDDIVCIRRSSATHFRTLAGITVAATAEQDMHGPPGVRAHRFQNRFKGIGCMRVVNVNSATVRMMTSQLHPAGCRLQMPQATDGTLCINAKRRDQRQRNQRVRRLKGTDQRHRHGVALLA